MDKAAVAEKSNPAGDVSQSDASGGTIPAALFPLALTPFEKYFVWDDRPDQPMTPVVELHFSTPLNQDALARAIEKVVAKNPMLNSRVVQRPGGLHWELHREAPKLLCAIKEPILIDGKLRPFDLSKEPASRFWYERLGGGSRVVWQLHHAASDGVGMRPVLIDILLYYAIETASDDPERYERELYCARFRQTELLHRSDVTHLPEPKRKLTAWQRIKNAHYFHFKIPRSLRSGASKSGVDSSAGRLLCSTELDAESSERVLEKCRVGGIAIHELALAVLFRTCAAWNRSLGDHNPNSHIRLMMPVDLRSRRDMRMPAVNRLSFMFFGRSYRQCDDFATLVESVRREFESTKETQLYLDFFNMIQATARWPCLMRWGLKRSDAMATAVLTYVGDVTRGTNRAFPAVGNTRPIGDAVFTTILGAPPVRRNTNISIGLGINWGQISISASWNRVAMTASDCEKFIELYKNGWQRWCDDKE